VQGWEFLDPANSLQIELHLLPTSPFVLVSSTDDDADKRVIYDFDSASPLEATISVSTVGVVDNKIVPIQHSLTFAPPSIQPIFLINFPYFTQKMQYDPDFGVVLNTASFGGCPGGLSAAQIAVIVTFSVVGAVMFVIFVAILAVIGRVIFVKWRRKQKPSSVHFDLEDTPAYGL